MIWCTAAFYIKGYEAGGYHGLVAIDFNCNELATFCVHAREYYWIPTFIVDGWCFFNAMMNAKISTMAKLRTSFCKKRFLNLLIKLILMMVLSDSEVQWFYICLEPQALSQVWSTHCPNIAIKHSYQMQQLVRLGNGLIGLTRFLFSHEGLLNM